MLKSISNIVNSIVASATGGLVNFTGPTAGQTRTITVPDANATMARTDAAQSFTGDQTLSNGNLLISAEKSVKLGAYGSVSGINASPYTVELKTTTSAAAFAQVNITANGRYGDIRLRTGFNGSAIPLADRVIVETAGHTRPGADNTQTLGSASFKWSVVYAGTGTINTSDEREKQDIEPLSAAEKRVAVALKGLVKKFRFKDAVAAKGDAARVHVGVIAQEVMDAFKAEGLDPMRYGIVCYDFVEEQQEVVEVKVGEDGQEMTEVIKPYVMAVDRYGIRYEELMAFIIASL